MSSMSIGAGGAKPPPRPEPRPDGPRDAAGPPPPGGKRLAEPVPDPGSDAALMPRGSIGATRDPRAPDGGREGAPGTSGVLGASLTGGQQELLRRAERALGAEQGSLAGALREGASLADLAEARGVDRATRDSLLQDGVLFDTRL